MKSVLISKGWTRKQLINSEMARDDINNLEIYQLAMSCGEITYSLILTWNQFNKNTIGYQLVRACDSIAANISERFGRYRR